MSRRKLFRIIEEGPTSHMFLIFIFKEGTRISLKVLYIGNSSSKWVAPFFSFLPCIFLSFSQFLLSLSHFLTFFYLSPISSLSFNSLFTLSHCSASHFFLFVTFLPCSLIFCHPHNFESAALSSLQPSCVTFPAFLGPVTV